MRHTFVVMTQHAARILLITLAGGFLALALTRLAPGVDEREIDTRLSDESRAAIRQSHEGEKNVFHFYWVWLRGLAHGDLGVSQALNRPVTELLSERLPVTGRLLGWGLLIGWTMGLGLAHPSGIVSRAHLRFGRERAGRIVSVSAGGRAGIAVCFAAGSSGARVGIISFPQDVSLCADPIAAKLDSAACSDGAS